MSPQQVSFAVCLSAVAFVALVAGQGVDPQACAAGARKALDNFRRELSQNIGELITEASKHGQDAANVDAMTQQGKEIIQALSDMGDSSNFTDAGRMSQAAQKAMNAYMGLLSKAIRSEPIISGMQMYAEFGSKTVPLYTKLATSMVGSCGPTRGGSRI